MTSVLRVVVCLLTVIVFSSFVSGCARTDQRSRAEQPASAPQVLSASASQVLAWLPGEQGAPGWKRAKAPQVFGPDNLWEFIDGAAETYLAFGFQELVSVTCAEPELAAEATIDIYHMADVLNAFGIYAQERNPNATFIEVGAEGYAAPNVLNFWNGPYYVKLRATLASDRVAASLQSLSKRISDAIGPAPKLPSIVPAFPSRAQIPHSIKYLPRDVLGQSYLADGFEAQYRAGSKSYRLTTASFESEQEAAGAFARYKAFIASAGHVARELRSSGNGGFVGSHPFYGLIVAIHSDRRLIVTLGAPSERSALDLITALLAGSSSRELP